jgi:hypothetical protein
MDRGDMCLYPKLDNNRLRCVSQPRYLQGKIE